MATVLRRLTAFILFILVLSGCSEQLDFDKGVQVLEEESSILIDQMENSLLAVNVKVQNNTGGKTEPFKVNIIVRDEAIATAMGDKEFLVGEDITPGGEAFEVDEGETYNIAATFALNGTKLSKEDVKAAVKTGQFEVKLTTEDGKVVTGKISRVDS